ncbi:SurA N-terminal domain-containing protein [Trujillonella humicola]|uniref:SurA N-terminal domain-containing protein n=1 Tax=Trujillonella humicola TaxID=3383699 RepID=UPI0039067620
MRRPAAVLALGLTAGLALTGCRTSPNVAAYVGEEQITVAALEREVDQRLADPAAAGTAGDDVGGYTREVLADLVNQRVLAAAAERYGVEVDESDVAERITALLGGADPEEAYAQLAARGFSREDVDASITQQLVVEEVAYAAGEAEEPDPADLRAQYAALLSSQEPRPLGIITVPDQATADTVVAELEADPSSYPALAGRYQGQTTLPQVDQIAPAQLPPALAEALLAAPAGTVLSREAPELGGVTVLYVPAFEEVAFALGEQARTQAQDAGRQLVLEVAGDLDISVNPRFGTYTEGSVVPVEGDAVRLLDETGQGAEEAALPPVGGGG